MSWVEIELPWQIGSGNIAMIGNSLEEGTVADALSTAPPVDVMLYGLFGVKNEVLIKNVFGPFDENIKHEEIVGTALVKQGNNQTTKPQCCFQEAFLKKDL